MPHQNPFTDASAAQPPPRPAARLSNWWQRALGVLARAEKRILKNFRVPPHGG
jgi:hypothetical protein